MAGCVVLLGCASRARRAHPQGAGASAAEHGQPAAEPTLSVLPELPRAQPLNAERVHQGLTMARQVLAAQLPAPPADHSSASLQSWVETQVTPWVEKRRESVAETRFQFGPQEEQAPADVVVTHAVLGLLHEDTALSLTRIPAPSELDQEPEIATMYRDLIRGQAQPFFNSAREDYRQCAQTGFDAGADLRRWATFCRARMERLPAAKH